MTMKVGRGIYRAYFSDKGEEGKTIEILLSTFRWKKIKSLE
jgi:hypothetical protein